MSPYAQVADIALRAMSEGQSATRAIADHFECTETAARNRICKARQAGFDIPYQPSSNLVPRVPNAVFEFDPMPWKQYAACWDSDPALFFPERGEDSSTAKAICAQCPCRKPCLQYALDNEIKHGIWGGVSEAERRRMRRDARRRSVA